jgi:hypothetical protein
MVIDPAKDSVGVLLASDVPPAPTIIAGCAVQLDASSRFVVAPVRTDDLGLDTITVDVPSNPSMVGVSFALQAFLVRTDDLSVASTNGLHLVLGF